MLPLFHRHCQTPPPANSREKYPIRFVGFCEPSICLIASICCFLHFIFFGKTLEVKPNTVVLYSTDCRKYHPCNQNAEYMPLSSDCECELHGFYLYRSTWFNFRVVGSRAYFGFDAAHHCHFRQNFVLGTKEMNSYSQPTWSTHFLSKSQNANSYNYMSYEPRNSVLRHNFPNKQPYFICNYSANEVCCIFGVCVIIITSFHIVFLLW